MKALHSPAVTADQPGAITSARDVVSGCQTSANDRRCDARSGCPQADDVNADCAALLAERSAGSRCTDPGPRHGHGLVWISCGRPDLGELIEIKPSRERARERPRPFDYQAPPLRLR